MDTKILSIFTFICIFHINAQNETFLNETTTSSPFNYSMMTTFFTSMFTTDDSMMTTDEPTMSTDEPTAFPTIEPTVMPTMQPTSDTMDPTMSPTTDPTLVPSTAPTIGLKEDEVRLFTLTQKLTGDGVDKSWVEDNKQLLITLCIEAAGAENDDGFRCDIGEIKEIYAGSSRRRILQGEVVGVNVEYLISIDNAESVNAFEEQVNSGGFDSNFNEGVSVSYPDITVETVSLTDEGTADPDELDKFFGEEEESFGEKITSEYLLLGIVCGVVGVVWLLFLRSTIENKYPSYLEAPAATSPSGSRAVEMVPQSSAASAADEEEELKEQNKQEMQQAWNEVDGGAETEL